MSSPPEGSTPTMPPPCVSGQSGRKQNENRHRVSRTTHSRKEKAYKDDRKSFGTAPIQYSRKHRGLLWRGWSALLRKMSHAKGNVLCKRHCPDGQEQTPNRMHLPAHGTRKTRNPYQPAKAQRPCAAAESIGIF